MTNPIDMVLANPSSVRTRRELALHWRENDDPRAALIERQLAQRDGLGMLSRKTIPREIDRLIEEHGREWAGRIAQLANNYSYELGLIAWVNVNGDQFVEHGSELVRLAPIVQLSIDPPVDLARLAAVPALAQVRILSVAGGPWLNDEAIVAFAKSTYIRNMRAIIFSRGQVGEAGQRALANSTNLPNLVYVDLTDNPCAAASSEDTDVTESMDRYYLRGPAAGPYLAEAYEAAARSYDSQALREWPPLDWRLAFDD